MIAVMQVPVHQHTNELAWPKFQEKCSTDSLKESEKELKPQKGFFRLDRSGQMQKRLWLTGYLFY